MVIVIVVVTVNCLHKFFWGCIMCATLQVLYPRCSTVVYLPTFGSFYGLVNIQGVFGYGNPKGMRFLLSLKSHMFTCTKSHV